MDLEHDRKDSRRKSCLDLVIVSMSLLPYIHCVDCVDKDQTITPRRVVETKKETKFIFSDHYDIKVELKGLPKQDKETMWKLNTPGGLETFKSLTDNLSAEVEEANDNESDINKVFKKI